MNIFSDHQTIVEGSAVAVLLLLPAFGMQSAYGHEYTALIKAKKYAEVTH
ncbi:hypothetical protein [Solimicrobium silvestre]|uniref:Uncharacterized protein n=1 Tax=Solimicrobium silvestre TaxID=2099400 RepID=A0A2S9GTV2_9BURK|nr:hypothetical protein [Solimicrobium silvestre]PRC91152.1 hypothetical protein S2091_4153 [Solimicrobium silvestre]